MIIGLSGYGRSGKDEAARGLVENHGFTRKAFADILREFLLAVNPIIKPAYIQAFAPLVLDMRLDGVIEKYGWDGYKESPYGPEIRELLQRLGTEGGRDLISDTIWIDATFKDAPRKLVIPDVRFPNEAEAIKERGGIVVRINRPGVGPANDHYSEVALDDWDFDYTYNNSAGISDLHYAMFGYAFQHALSFSVA